MNTVGDWVGSSLGANDGNAIGSSISVFVFVPPSLSAIDRLNIVPSSLVISVNATIPITRRTPSPQIDRFVKQKAFDTIVVLCLRNDDWVLPSLRCMYD